MVIRDGGSLSGARSKASFLIVQSDPIRSSDHRIIGIIMSRGAHWPSTSVQYGRGAGRPAQDSDGPIRSPRARPGSDH
eukprot:765109-Hanusia_phi.AAC.8